MATIRDRILDYLQQHPDGVDDDTLAEALGLKQRQQANSHCRQLEAEGLVRRVTVHGKIHNYLTSAGANIPEPALSLSPSEKPWFWEGNVQDRVVETLEAQGYTIHFAANTASREAGKDIVAERDGRPLWVTVKGYPEGTGRTRPSTQARHWFTHALYDLIVWRGESESADIALALPDFRTYHNMAEKVTWFHRVAAFAYLWVCEDGTITREISRLPQG